MERRDRKPEREYEVQVRAKEVQDSLPKDCNGKDGRLCTALEIASEKHASAVWSVGSSEAQGFSFRSKRGARDLLALRYVFGIVILCK